MEILGDPRGHQGVPARDDLDRGLNARERPQRTTSTGQWAWRGLRQQSGDRLAGRLGVVRLRIRRAHRCEVRPKWLDHDGLQPAAVSRGPRLGGTVALEFPEPARG
jgi:hypothetical protein